MFKIFIPGALFRNAMRSVLFLMFIAKFTVASGQSVPPFECTPLTVKTDLSVLMVAKVDTFLMRETENMKRARSAYWHRDFSSVEAFNASIAFERELLMRRLGVVDPRVSPDLQMVTNTGLQLQSVETETCVINAVSWEIFDGLHAEGLLLRPKGKVSARVVMVPDADILPEVLAGLENRDSRGYGVARKLTEAGCEVLVPVLVNRTDTFSGNASLGRFTNMPHREWIYRQGYEVGRHVIGYELQKIFSAIDWFESQNRAEGRNVPIGVAGYGEGGLLALSASALDTRISSTLVSGYFSEREEMWQEPIYRNIFGFLKYFGDAELAVMSWPRTLVVEYANGPEINGPPKRSKGRSGAAPGSLNTPLLRQVNNEFQRAEEMIAGENRNLHFYSNGVSAFPEPFSHGALAAFGKGLNLNISEKPALPDIPYPLHWIDTVKRQERTVKEMEQTIQREVILCERSRNEHFWEVLKEDTAKQRSVRDTLREQFGNQIGQLPVPAGPFNTKARLLQKTAKWTSYEVVLDVWPGVFAWGILLVPNDLKAGEKRPVIVCQHGLEGVPMDVVTTDSTAENYHFYKGFASQLADRGYITFAPFNLYRGGDKFRVLQRKANPLGLTLFSVIIGQHERIVEWLRQLSFADSDRIAFYGLSYGGKSAMRIPAVVKGYCLSICSGDFNEWIRKCASTDYKFSYMYTGEYDMQEWDLGHTFSYAEMAGLIAPRPFMVERGHLDNVADDEWVAYEFAKVRKYYDLIGLPLRTRIEFFTGPHTIHGVGTFEFLDMHLRRGHR